MKAKSYINELLTEYKDANVSVNQSDVLIQLAYLGLWAVNGVRNWGKSRIHSVMTVVLFLYIAYSLYTLFDKSLKN